MGASHSGQQSAKNFDANDLANGVDERSGNVTLIKSRIWSEILTILSLKVLDHLHLPQLQMDKKHLQPQANSKETKIADQERLQIVGKSFSSDMSSR